MYQSWKLSNVTFSSKEPSKTTFLFHYFLKILQTWSLASVTGSRCIWKYRGAIYLVTPAISKALIRSPKLNQKRSPSKKLCFRLPWFQSSCFLKSLNDCYCSKDHGSGNKSSLVLQYQLTKTFEESSPKFVSHITLI